MGSRNDTVHAARSTRTNEDRWVARGLLLTAVLLAAPLAGCAGGEQAAPGGDEASGGGGDATAGIGEPFVAQRPLDTAFSEAEAWRSDAELVGVAAIEADGSTTQASGGDAWGPATSEETIPDGRTNAWAYHFFGESSWYTVTVHADGSIETNETDDSHGLSSSFTGWNIDSSEAARIALNNSAFADVADDENAVVQFTLQSQGDGPFWRIRAHSPSADSSPGIEVDASSGDSFQYAS